MLTPADPVSGRYSAVWNPSEPNEGVHTIYFRATDKAGNKSDPVAVSLTIDMTPPVLSVSTLSDGAWTNNEILNVSGSAADNFGIQVLTAGGVEVAVGPGGVFSHAMVLKEGPNQVAVTARDEAGNESSEERTIFLDRGAPDITISEPADNAKFRTPTVVFSGMVGEEAAVIIRIGGAPAVAVDLQDGNFSLPVTLVYGINTVELIATDRAGNTSSAKRTLTFDDRSPSLAVTVPAEDIKTNQGEMTVRGEVGDITAATVTVTMDGVDYVPAVVNGMFEQRLTFTAEKIYQIFVKAVDEAGNETIVQRNVVYDATAPEVTLDPVMSPTNVDSQILAGTMEAGAAIDVYCPTAAAGEVTYPTPTTWTAALSNMQEGENAVTVVATDEAGNASLPVNASILVDLTPPSPPTIISPSDGSFSISSLVDIRGITEPGATVRMVHVETLSVQADPAGDFVFEQVRLASGRNDFILTAADTAGNTGGRTLYTLYFDISRWLTGAIAVRPELPYQGQDVTFAYSVTNSGGVAISDLAVRVIIIDSDTSEIRNTREVIASVPANTTRTGDFTLSTLDLRPKAYNAVLEVSSVQMAGPKMLATARFEVRPGVEARKSMPDVTNVLVWINDGCRNGDDGRSVRPAGSFGESDGGEDDCRSSSPGGPGMCNKCIRRDIVSKTLSKAAAGHHMAETGEDFASELRSPFYTDVLILGDRHPLGDHHWEELREKVHSGTGLISSLWLRHAEGDEREVDEVLGVVFRGGLDGRLHDVRMMQSPVTSEGVFRAEGKAIRTRPGEGTATAAWFEAERCGERRDGGLEGGYPRSHDDCHEDRGPSVGAGDDDGEDGEDEAQRSPAITLRTYGNGRAIFFGFDLGAALGEDSHRLLSDILVKSLRYIHDPERHGHYPGSLLPVQLEYRSFGVPYDLEVTETYPPLIRLYDPVASAWVTAAPWTRSIRLGAGETRRLMHYALLPDAAGTFTLRTDTAYREEGAYESLGFRALDIVVERDLRGLAGDLLQALEAGNFGAAGKTAMMHVRRVLKRPTISRDAIEANIEDILKAVNALLRTDAEISRIRFMLDDLLKGWQSRYYFWSPAV